MNEPVGLAWLERRFRRIFAVEGAAGMLAWDRSVLMPAGGAEVRAEQLATLSSLAHELICDARVAEELDRARSESVDHTPWQAANLREMQRRWVRATAVPSDLVEAAERARSTTEMAWREARAHDAFADVAPLLEESLALERETARAMGSAEGLSPYDTMLDLHDPGLRDADVTPLFEELGRVLPELVERALARQDAAPAPIALEGPFAVEAQRALCERLMQAWGFDFAHGRLDTSHHPFTGGTPDDVRITTRFDTSSFLSGLMGVLHETGHALYERGLPAAWRGQPVGHAAGMTAHESQSLILEMQACRSSEFIGYLAPLVREAFGRDGRGWTAENLERHYRRVERSLIRVDADELTYPLHVIVRHRLERELVGGGLRVAEIPGAWRETMRSLVGVEPSDDRDGCLQDIHWYAGAWGYFPTYTLGAMAAAQLFDAARRAEPALLPGLARGDFAPLMHWLRAHLHSQGSLHLRPELIEEATGAPLGARAFEAHLRRRYLAEEI